MSLNCIRCGKELESAMPAGFADETNQPYAGTSFASPGHYGSTVFDPMNGTRLEINVCDVCLVAAAREGRVLHVTPRAPLPAQVDLNLWDPDEPGHG